MKEISKCLVVVMVCFGVIGLAFTAQAASYEPNYVVLKGGIYSPQSKELGDFSTGFNGELAYGLNFSRNWAFEFGVGYLTTKANQESSRTTVSADADIKTMPVTVALKGIYPINNLELYGIGGMGAYFVFADLDLDYYGNRHASYSDNKTLFGGFLGLGVTMNISPKVFLGLEGKYLWTTKTTFRDTDKEVDLGGIQATFNVGYRF
jgi:opacity protein-like surface antigen